MEHIKCNKCPHECYIRIENGNIKFCPMDGKPLSEQNDKHVPLTIEELIGMYDQAVWIQHKGDPNNGHWGVVEGVSEMDGNKYLYLWDEPGHYQLNDCYEAYRNKPERR